GLLKLGLQAAAGSGALGDSGLLYAFGTINFLYYSGMLFLVSVIVVIVASLTAPAPAPATIAGLTYSEITKEQHDETRRSIGTADILGTLLVLGMVLGIYLYFSFWLN